MKKNEKIEPKRKGKIEKKMGKTKEWRMKKKENKMERKKRRKQPVRYQSPSGHQKPAFRALMTKNLGPARGPDSCL